MEYMKERDRYIRRMLRLDDNEEESEGKRGEVSRNTITPKETHESHGNTRLPFGLCKGVGIDTTGMTPREAWDALRRGYGIKPSDVYDYVEEHGSAEGFMDDRNTPGKAARILKEEGHVKGLDTDPQNGQNAEKKPTEEQKVKVTLKKSPKFDEEAYCKKLSERVDNTTLSDDDKKGLKDYIESTARQAKFLDMEDLPSYWDFNKAYYGQKFDEGEAEFDKLSKQYSYSACYTGNSDDIKIYSLLQEIEEERWALQMARDCLQFVAHFNSSLYDNYTQFSQKDAEDTIKRVGSHKGFIDSSIRRIHNNDEFVAWLKAKMEALPTQEEIQNATNERLSEISEEINGYKTAWDKQKKNPYFGKSGVREYSHCNTIDEAEVYIKDKLGIEQVDYSKMEDITPERANAINNALMSMYENYGVKPAKIISDPSMGSGTMAYWRDGDKTLALCHLGVAFGDDAKSWKWWEEDIGFYKKAYDEEKAQYERLMQQGDTERAKIYKRLMGEAEQSKEKALKNQDMPYNYFHKGKVVETLIAHEMGHALIKHAKEKDNIRRGKKISDVTFEFNDKTEKGLYADVEQHGDFDKLSGYAQTSPAECFAECFAMYQMGDKDSLPDYAIKWVEDIIKAQMNGENEEVKFGG